MTDWSRFAKNMGHPGIDPRVWVSLAVVQKFVVVRDEGCFADVLLLPSQVQETARVGAVYAGDGFGLYAPLVHGEEVLVAAPSGDPNEGLVVVARMWSPADKPPADRIAFNPNDLLLCVKPDRTVRIVAQGNGNIVLQASDEGKVYIGNETGTDAPVKATALRTFLEHVRAFMDEFVNPVTGWANVPIVEVPLATALKAAFPTGVPAIGTIEAEKVEVK